MSAPDHSTSTPPSAAARGTALEVAGLGLTFGGLRVLDGVDVEVGPGTVHGLIGPNGAGKTSLLNCLSGLYRPDRGTIAVGGTGIQGRRPHRIAALGVARVFQNIQLVEGADVRTNVLVGRHRLMRSGPLRELVGWPPARRDERRHSRRVDEILATVGLEDLAGALVATLPYGTQKLVELARGLAMEPQLLLLDEPVAGMSPAERTAVAEAIRWVRDELGLTVVLVEHDVELVMRLADQVTVLVSGRVLVTGPPHLVRHDERVIQAYIGDGQARSVAAATRQTGGADLTGPGSARPVRPPQPPLPVERTMW